MLLKTTLVDTPTGGRAVVELVDPEVSELARLAKGSYNLPGYL